MHSGQIPWLRALSWRCLVGEAHDPSGFLILPHQAHNVSEAEFCSVNASGETLAITLPRIDDSFPNAIGENKKRCLGKSLIISIGRGISEVAVEFPWIALELLSAYGLYQAISSTADGWNLLPMERR